MPIQMDDETKAQVKAIFEKLVNDVKFIVFVNNDPSCQFCNETVELIDLIASMSDKISVEKHVCESSDCEEAKKYKVDKFPAIILHGAKPYNIRYFGIPSGHEFGALIEDVVHASTGQPDLSQEAIAEISKIDKELHLQVFITPTCPYCPISVHMAHQAAMVNDKITADMVEAMEFPDLARKYNVYGVPKTVINDKVEFEGAVPEQYFLQMLLKAANES